MLTRRFCGLLVACFALQAQAASNERSLKQADGPGIINRPLSATPADLVNDPSGRAHLLARLGNPPEYFGRYAYPRPEGEYAIDPKIDPNVVAHIPGNDSPANGSYKVIGNSGMIAVHAIPFPNGEILFYGRPAEPYGGGDPGGPGLNYLRVGEGNNTWTEIAAIYTPANNTYRPFHIPEAPFCGAQTLLPDGRAIIVGGEHVNLWYPYLQYGGVAVRIYDPATHTIETVNNFDRARWYPSIMTMADGNQLVVGGGQQEVGGWSVSDAATSKSGTYETQGMLSGKCIPNGAGPSDPYWDNPSYTIYNVSSNTLSPSLTLTILLEAWPVNLYPFLFLMPTGSTLIVTGTQMGAMFLTADGATQDEEIGDLPQLPLPVGPNQYTPVTLLPLSPPNYEAQVLVAGGSSDYCPNSNSPGNNESYLIDVTPGANHSVVTEQLAYGRVMGDLTLLPDGRVFLSGGAQVGLGGGGGPRYSAMDEPTTVAEIYDPSKPIGQRWKTVGDTQIPRLYHSTALLTSNATVLLAGSETSSERRVQIWTPDYLLTGKPRPIITSAPANATYNGTLAIGYSNVSSIDRVVLYRPGVPTHGNHFDERCVVLNFTSSGGGNLTATVPPTPYIAPPGQYMIFILSGGVPSVATYVSIQDAESLRAPAPLPATGLFGGVSAPSEGGPLESEAPQGPAALANPFGTNGVQAPDFVEESRLRSSTAPGSSPNIAGVANAPGGSSASGGGAIGSSGSGAASGSNGVSAGK